LLQRAARGSRRAAFRARDGARAGDRLADRLSPAPDGLRREHHVEVAERVAGDEHEVRPRARGDAARLRAADDLRRAARGGDERLRARAPGLWEMRGLAHVVLVAVEGGPRVGPRRDPHARLVRGAYALDVPAHDDPRTLERLRRDRVLVAL